MASFEIPSTGLHLSLHPSADKAGPEELRASIFRLDLSEEKTKDILKFLKAGKPVSLHTGNQTSLQFGENKIKLQNVVDTFSSEIYSRSKGNADKMYFSGKLHHTLEVQKAREDTAKANDALATLQHSLKSLKEEKAMNETTFVSSREDMKKIGKDHKPSPLVGGRRDFLKVRSTPSSPYLNAANSPRPGPTSAPLSATTNKDKIRLEAIKIPLIHLLASRPMTAKAIAEKLRAPKEDCDRLLDKLREKAYRDLDVWKFPFKSKEDRQAAIDRAIHAYDRLRLDKKDHLWQLLLPKEERGKGKVLSRLNFDKPDPTLKPMKIDERGDTSDVDKTTKKVSEKRKAEDGDGGPKKKVKVSSLTLTKKKDVKPGRSPAPAGKFKSSERIEDSDEEADAAATPAKRIESPIKKAQPLTAPASPAIKPTMSPSPKKQLHKSSLSNSSSSGDNSDFVDSKHSLKPPSKDPLTSKHSPRSRHDSSPQKPSPLGSSPPTNSTDTDTSSTGKEASQSSAPSSPPSSTEMPVPKQKNTYSPIITERPRDVSRGRPTVKRKPEEYGQEPPPKRQQLNGVHTSSKLTNRVTQHKPVLERKISDSERSSSSEKVGPAREDVVDDAKRFQKYYTRYKEFHDKLSKIPEEERDEKEVDDLLRMHNRLKEMKAEIWVNWDKAERTTVSSR
jgi:RNA polymerase II elongation factor ELL